MRQVAASEDNGTVGLKSWVKGEVTEVGTAVGQVVWTKRGCRAVRQM